MPFLCIPQEKINEFKKALKDKELNFRELLDMTTEERTALFEKFAGKDAKAVNTLFEEKLILKNRIQGLKNWASKVGQIGRYDPLKKVKIDQLISEYKARQQERIFSPKEHEAFLADLAEETLGVRISKEEAKTTFDLRIKADELKKGFDETISPKIRTPEQQKNAIAYGAAEIISKKYIEALKSGDLSMKNLVKKTIYETKQSWKENKPKTIADLLLNTLKTITNNSISLVATFDNSFIGRQGLKTLQTHPKIWLNMAQKSFVDFYKTMKGIDAQDALYADVYSRPNYINGSYDIAKLIPKTEEQFPTSLPERIPGLGRVFKASENAFVNSAIRARIDLFDFLAEKAKKNGVEWDKTQIQDNGKLVSSLTARGQWGTRGEGGIVRLVLWAPRMLKGNWDVLTLHTGTTGLETVFARKEAALNLVKIVGETALLIMIANALKPGSAETDPTSSNFGKIKVGNTTFDYTGGAASLITLAAREITNTTKSATTGVKTQLGTGYGQMSRFDVFLNFLTGKTTPPVNAIISWMKGRNFQGKKPTIGSTLYGAFTPISIQNAIQLKDERSTEAVLGVILDGLGVNVNTFQSSQTDWGQNAGVELQQFKTKIGDVKFKEANNLYNKKVNDWLNSIKIDTRFSTLSDEEKQSVITKKKTEIKEKIFRQYNFKYKAPIKKVLPKF